MATSRIFVTGLPPQLREDDFKAHFSKRRPITDAKLMPQRRIGYVGYKTSKDAEAAVKYFNKSFLRMSKLHVELAHSLQSQNAQSGDRTEEASSKRNKNFKQEYDVKSNRMRPRESKPIQRLDPPQDNTKENNVPNKRPSSADTKDMDEAKSEPPNSAGDVRPSSPQPIVTAQAGFGSATDDDWMRSRTSRLLGLMDEDEEAEKGDIIGVSSQTEKLGCNIKSEPAKPDYQKDTQDTSDRNASEDFESQSPLSETQRIFLRNLVFSTGEDDIRSLLSPYREDLLEVQVPHNFQSGKCKGFAFAQFKSPAIARQAIRELDGTSYQGRLLHVLLATGKRESKLDEFALAQMRPKKRRMIEKKQHAPSSTFNWNSMFMNADAIVSSTAARLGVSKSEVLDSTSSDAAVKQAQAETNTIISTRKYFEHKGIDLTSFASGDRKGKALLVKNFKYETTPADLQNLFSENSDLKVSRILMPPAGTIAIVEFSNEMQAALALRTFAYRKLKDSVLFLERAPTNLLKGQYPDGSPVPEDQIKKDPKLLQSLDDQSLVDVQTSTLFVRNLNFTTTSDRLWNEFRTLKGLKSALVKTRADPKNEGKLLSMGFGFLEFHTDDNAKVALKALQGHVLDGHELQVRASHQGSDAAADRKRRDFVKRQKERSSKILIKNLPFEASRQDVRHLMKSYGQLRALRMPKRLDNHSRGYAFAQFNTAKEAENALNALSSTHLLGRRLVLQYAADEPEDPEEQIAQMQQKVGKQRESIALRQLKASQRKKLNLDDSNEVDGA